MKKSSFSKIVCFLFFRFWHFTQENDVTNLAPNFGFSNMGYLMALSERTFHKDLKRYNVLKFEFPAIFSNNTSHSTSRSPKILLSLFIIIQKDY